MAFGSRLRFGGVPLETASLELGLAQGGGVLVESLARPTVGVGGTCEIVVKLLRMGGERVGSRTLPVDMCGQALELLGVSPQVSGATLAVTGRRLDRVGVTRSRVEAEGGKGVRGHEVRR